MTIDISTIYLSAEVKGAVRYKRSGSKGKCHIEYIKVGAKSRIGFT